MAPITTHWGNRIYRSELPSPKQNGAAPLATLFVFHLILIGINTFHHCLWLLYEGNSTLCFCRAFIWEFDFSDWATKWHSNFENVNGISQLHMVAKYTVSHLKNTMPHCSSLMAGNDTNLSSMIEPSIKLRVAMTNYVGKSLVHLDWTDKELGALIRHFVLVTVAPKRYIVLPQWCAICT